MRSFAALLLCVSGSVTAATIWNGPSVTFTKTAFANPALPANQDFLTSNVALTRGNLQGLYNASQETGYASTSPADTQWAFQGLRGNPATGVSADNFGNLIFSPWVVALGGMGALIGNIFNRPGVVHLVTDDVYLDIMFTRWGVGTAGGGSFSYTRSSPVPLPGTAGFLLAGLTGSLIFRRHRLKAAADRQLTLAAVLP